MSFADDMREEMGGDDLDPLHEHHDEMDHEYDQGYTDGMQDERQRITKLLDCKQAEYWKATPEIFAVLETLSVWVKDGRSVK